MGRSTWACLGHRSRCTQWRALGASTEIVVWLELGLASCAAPIRAFIPTGVHRELPCWRPRLRAGSHRTLTHGRSTAKYAAYILNSGVRLVQWHPHEFKW